MNKQEAKQAIKDIADEFASGKPIASEREDELASKAVLAVAWLAFDIADSLREIATSQNKRTR